MRVMIRPELRRTSTSQSHRLTTSTKVVNYLLSMYVTVGIIVDVDARLLLLEEGPRENRCGFRIPVFISSSLWARMYRCKTNHCVYYRPAQNDAEPGTTMLFGHQKDIVGVSGTVRRVS